MAIPEHNQVDFPESGANVVVGDGDVLNVGQLTEKGYDYIRDVGAAFTAELQGSVGGQNWTSIANLNASAQGDVLARYNFLRVHATVQGAKGATTRLVAAGKNL